MHGSVIRAGTINGPVTVVSQSGPPVRDVLADIADQLAQAVGTRWQREEVVSPFDLLNSNRTTTLFRSLLFGSAIGVAPGIMGVVGFGLVVRLTGAAAMGFASGLAIGLGLTAWGQWAVFSRTWLPLTGRLPRAVAAFLDDAYRRGVLRQVGAVYQFRHARLQDHLVHAHRTHRDTRRVR